MMIRNPLPADMADPFYEKKWLNLSPAEAMNLPAVDPVAHAYFAQSRAYGELLVASLARTDDMLTPCKCGAASVFCACPVREGETE